MCFILLLTGFGQAVPSGKLGRAFLCIYALLGIPLLLVTLATIGKYCSGVWDAVLSRISYKKCSVNKNKDVYSTGILIFLGLIGVILIPAAIFQSIEERWSYGDAVYFTIISLTTIGIGDLTPSPEHLTKPHFISLYLIWLFTGLAVISVLVAKLSILYSRLNESIIVLSKRCFKKCLRIKKDDQIEHNLLSNEQEELDTM